MIQFNLYHKNLLRKITVKSHVDVDQLNGISMVVFTVTVKCPSDMYKPDFSKERLSTIHDKRLIKGKILMYKNAEYGCVVTSINPEILSTMTEMLEKELVEKITTSPNDFFKFRIDLPNGEIKKEDQELLLSEIVESLS